MNQITGDFIDWMTDTHKEWFQDKAEELIESGSTIKGEYQAGYSGVDYELKDIIEQDVVDELTSKNHKTTRALLEFLENWIGIDWGEVELVVGKIKKDIIKENNYDQ